MDRDIAALIAYLDSRVARPHEWGSDANDCVSFFDGAVIAQTGRSCLEGLSWSNKTGAIRVLKRVGGLVAELDRRFDRVPIAHAHRGDIAGVPAEEMLGLDADELALIGLHPFVIEGMLMSTPGERGLERVPRSRATVAWDIASLKVPADV